MKKIIISKGECIILAYFTISSVLSIVNRLLMHHNFWVPYGMAVLGTIYFAYITRKQ